MMVAHEFIHEIGSINFVLSVVGISKSTFYYKPQATGSRGKRISTHTRHRDGFAVLNDVVLQAIASLLEQEFVDYGYHKVTIWLQRCGFIINKKKVYRLMRAALLLLPKPSPVRSKKTWVKELLPVTEVPFDYMEFDIKYIKIDGTERNAYLLTVIDVMSRFNMGQLLQYSMRKEDVLLLFEDIFSMFALPTKITVRSDNGSQFEAEIVREYFASMNVKHEFTKPGTPEQNAHIESYHSIVQRAVCDRISFDSLEHAQDTFERFRNFYNFDRLHSGVGFATPGEKLRSLHVDVPIPSGFAPYKPQFLQLQFSESQS